MMQEGQEAAIRHYPDHDDDDDDSSDSDAIASLIEYLHPLEFDVCNAHQHVDRSHSNMPRIRYSSEDGRIADADDQTLSVREGLYRCREAQHSRTSTAITALLQASSQIASCANSRLVEAIQFVFSLTPESVGDLRYTIVENLLRVQIDVLEGLEHSSRDPLGRQACVRSALMV